MLPSIGALAFDSNRTGRVEHNDRALRVSLADKRGAWAWPCGLELGLWRGRKGGPVGEPQATQVAGTYVPTQGSFGQCW